MTPDEVKRVQAAQNLVKNLHCEVLQLETAWHSAHNELRQKQNEFSDAVNALAAMALPNGGDGGT